LLKWLFAESGEFAGVVDCNEFVNMPFGLVDENNCLE
jgi:hypothetical protein